MTKWNTKDGIPEMRCEFIDNFTYKTQCKNRFKFQRFITNSSIDFEKGTNDARAIGWKVWTENGTWHHLCPDHADITNNKNQNETR